MDSIPPVDSVLGDGFADSGKVDSEQVVSASGDAVESGGKGWTVVMHKSRKERKSSKRIQRNPPASVVATGDQKHGVVSARESCAGEGGRDRGPRVKLDGVMKIWGTLQSTTTAAVANAISSLTNLAPGSLKIKRKVSLLQNRRRGPLSFIVEFQDGRVRRRHVDHVRIRYPEEPNWAQQGVLEGLRVPQQEAEPQEDGPTEVPDQAVDDGVPAVEVLPPVTALRRSARNRRPPDKLLRTKRGEV